MFHNKTKWQNPKVGTLRHHPKKKFKKYFVLPCFDYFMVSFLWSIGVKTIENCRRRPFYNSTKKLERNWLLHDNSGDKLKMVENGFILDFDQLQILQITNLDYKSWVILFLTSLLITSDWQEQQTNKWISEKHLSAVNRLKTKFLLQLVLKVCNFLINENNSEGQHTSGISNPAVVKNRVCFWQMSIWLL